MSKSSDNTRNKILVATWHLMEENQGQGVRMSDIAKRAGVSRQAVYLHFANRTDLIIATIAYVDQQKGLGERMASFNAASDGLHLLDQLVEVWGDYMPEIAGISRAMLSTRNSDADMAAAWNKTMGCLKAACRKVITALESDGLLAKNWTTETAVDLSATLLSFQNWEQLTSEYGWSGEHYKTTIKTVLIRALTVN